MERIVRHRQSKEPATDRPLLTYRATFRLHYGIAAEILGIHFVTRLPLIFLKMDMTSVLCRSSSDTKMCER